jgi:hypothetical protein
MQTKESVVHVNKVMAKIQQTSKCLKFITRKWWVAINVYSIELPLANIYYIMNSSDKLSWLLNYINSQQWV